MVELLSPAGDIECLETVVDYGCNAVYLGGKSFGMRAGAKNFTAEELRQGVEYAHSHNVKVHLTLNTLPSNDDIAALPEFIALMADCGIDAVIVCDLGVMSLVQQYAPNLEIHMSTQVGITNYQTANQLYKLGAKRIVLAREVPINEIRKIRKNIPDDMEIETFVHGAMCVSFSGRCLLSAYMTGRDANKGECAQPCRWKYYLVEENRKDSFFQIDEDEKGSYILNARDMCMIEHLEELIDAGVSSFKIEGRAKSAYYGAIITNAYRAAIDCAINKIPIADWIKNEVNQVSHRPYCTGFYFGTPEQYYESSGYERESDFVGVVDGYSDGILEITQRNYFTIHDRLEIIAPQRKPESFVPKRIINSEGVDIEIANRATEKLKVIYEKQYPKNSIIRKKVNV